MTYSVAVSGASGYAGGEILRLLAQHPDVDIRTVTAHSNAGQPLIEHQPHLRSLSHLTLQDTTPETLAGHDIVVLALPHGQSAQYTDALGDVPLVIDAGADREDRLQVRQPGKHIRLLLPDDGVFDRRIGFPCRLQHHLAANRKQFVPAPRIEPSHGQEDATFIRIGHLRTREFLTLTR